MLSRSMSLVARTQRLALRTGLRSFGGAAGGVEVDAARERALQRRSERGIQADEPAWDAHEHEMLHVSVTRFERTLLYTTHHATAHTHKTETVQQHIYSYQISTSINAKFSPHTRMLKTQNANGMTGRPFFMYFSGAPFCWSALVRPSGLTTALKAGHATRLLRGRRD